MSGTSSLGKRGGIQRGALGDASSGAVALLVFGTSSGTPPGTIVFRRTLSSLGTRAGERQLIKVD